MSKIRKLISVVLTGVMLLSVAGCSVIQRTAESKGKTVLAKVGDEKITLDDVDQLLYYTYQQYKEYYGKDFKEQDDLKDKIKELRTQALDSLIAEKVLLAKEKDLKVKYTDKEINDEVKETVDYYKSYYETNDKYKEFIKSYGYTEKSFKKYWKTQTILSKIANSMVKDVKDPTDKEIETYYNENLENYVKQPGANVVHILFADSDEGKQEALAAKELVLQGKTLKEVSEMDQYKGKCTYEDLGYQVFDNNTTLVSDFVNGFKDLPEGQVSDPVETSYGWHLIMTSGVNKEAKQQTLDEVKKDISNTLLTKKKSEEYSTKLEKYKEELNVKIYDDRL